MFGAKMQGKCIVVSAAFVASAHVRPPASDHKVTNDQTFVGPVHKGVFTHRGTGGETHAHPARGAWALPQGAALRPPPRPQLACVQPSIRVSVVHKTGEPACWRTLFARRLTCFIALSSLTLLRDCHSISFSKGMISSLFRFLLYRPRCKASVSLLLHQQTKVDASRLARTSTIRSIEARGRESCVHWCCWAPPSLVTCAASCTCFWVSCRQHTCTLVMIDKPSLPNTAF